MEADGRFRLPLAMMPLGEHTLSMTLTRGQHQQEITTKVTLHYRLTPDPIDDQDLLVVTVETREGWTLVSPRAKAGGDGRYRLELDLESALAAADARGEERARFPLSLVLAGPEGNQRRFAETLELAMPKTPLRLAEPARGWVTTADVVQVRGRTLPGATVTAGGRKAKADRKGIFAIYVPIDAVGPQTVDVQSDGIGRRPKTTSVEVERISARGAKTRKKRLLRRARKTHPKAKRKIRYSALRKSDNPLLGRSVRLGGVVLEVRRDLGQKDVVLFSLCRDLARCPVWLETKDPILVGQGEPAIVYGRFAGMAEYSTAQGQKRSIPRLEDAILIP